MGVLHRCTDLDDPDCCYLGRHWAPVRYSVADSVGCNAGLLVPIRTQARCTLSLDNVWHRMGYTLLWRVAVLHYPARMLRRGIPHSNTNVFKLLRLTGLCGSVRAVR